MKRTLFLLILLLLSISNAWAERFTVTNDNNEKIIVDVAKPLNQAAKGLVFFATRTGLINGASRNPNRKKSLP